MQPTNRQVERSLAALLADDPTGTPAGRDGEARSGPEERAVPDGVLEAIHALPAVRSDRLDEARSLVAAGSYPDAEVLAQKMVGRIVCDRLR